jgi:hypothetical protein
MFVNLKLHAILGLLQMFLKKVNNGAPTLELRVYRQVGEGTSHIRKQGRRIIAVDCLKGSEPSKRVMIGVVPPFSKW